MAVKIFPFTFRQIRGTGVVVVDEIKDQGFLSFAINVNDKKGNETVIWNPERKEIVENMVIRKQTYSKQMFEAISGFWAIYND